jgi:hypothetical protein
MTAADFATAGFVDERFRYLVSLVERLVPAPKPAQAEVVLYSIQKLAAVLEVHPETVRLWLSKGKRGREGSIIKLQAYKFTSEPRIPWPALLAYERGEVFDLSTLPAPVLLPPAELAPAPLPKPAPPDTPGVLRVA